MEAKINKPVYFGYKWAALLGRSDFSKDAFVH